MSVSEATLLQDDLAVFCVVAVTALTAPTTSTSGHLEGVGDIVRMPLGAVCFAPVLCGSAQTATDVLGMCDSFQVQGIEAVSHATEMVYDPPGWNPSDQPLVDDSVSRLVGSRHLDDGVTLPRDWTLPQPATAIQVAGNELPETSPQLPVIKVIWQGLPKDFTKCRRMRRYVRRSMHGLEHGGVL